MVILSTHYKSQGTSSVQWFQVSFLFPFFFPPLVIEHAYICFKIGFTISYLFFFMHLETFINPKGKKMPQGKKEKKTTEPWQTTRASNSGSNEPEPSNPLSNLGSREVWTTLWISIRTWILQLIRSQWKGPDKNIK